MTTPFGTFTPRAQASGDKLQARALIGRPILVQVTGYDPAKQVKDQNTGTQVIKPAVFVDVWDFLGGPAVPSLNIPVQPPNSVYIGAMWMSGAIVDNLKDQLGGAPMPVRIVSRQAKNNYLTIVPLGNPEFDSDPQGPAQLQGVTQAFLADPQRFERERAARLAAAAQQGVPAAQPGFQPGAVQPSGFPGAPAQAQQYQQAPNMLGQQPPAGFPGAPAAAQQMPQQAPNGMTPGQQVNAGMMSPAQTVQAYTAPQQPAPAAPQFQQPAAPQQTGGMAGWNGQQTMHPAAGAQSAFGQAAQPELAQMAQQQAAQFAQAGFPGMPQGAPAQAPAAPGMQVNNSDVAAILAGLQGQPPTQ